MVFYRACLVAILLAVSLADYAFPARQSVCITCHQPHYSGKGSCVSCHRGDDRTGRKEIAHYDLVAGRFAHYKIEGSPVAERGKKLLERFSCRRCHRYAEKGNHLAGSLDVTGATGKVRDIYESIRVPVLFMPNFHANDAQIADLVNAILARAKFQKPPVGETALIVHFQDVKNIRKNVFAGKCGKCHKILSEQSGGLGSGYIGPNLSGLFSEFYPRTYRDAESWNPDKLKKWLENPRDIRINAMMPPVRLAPEEFEQLRGIIQLDKSLPDAPR
ncbi:MAG: cytochrome c [Syntrophales bacterium]|nr:cytochrome c [Syntrophales bacterium]